MTSLGASPDVKIVVPRPASVVVCVVTVEYRQFDNECMALSPLLCPSHDFTHALNAHELGVKEKFRGLLDGGLFTRAHNLEPSSSAFGKCH